MCLFNSQTYIISHLRDRETIALSPAVAPTQPSSNPSRPRSPATKFTILAALIALGQEDYDQADYRDQAFLSTLPPLVAAPSVTSPGQTQSDSRVDGDATLPRRLEALRIGRPVQTSSGRRRACQEGTAVSLIILTCYS